MQNIQASKSANPIVAALTSASKQTGADFDYLLSTAIRESSLKPEAKSKTSSASGLFQFIDQTWLDLMRRHGHEVGFGDLSTQISRQSSGRHVVPDETKKQEIIALKLDPKISAHMAGKFAEESRQAVEAKLGRKLAQGELYIAHFMGASGGANLISAAASKPDELAATLFPSAARANRAIFYHADGSARTVKEVYNRLTKSEPPQLPASAPSNDTAPAEIPRSFRPSLAAMKGQIQTAHNHYSDIGQLSDIGHYSNVRQYSDIGGGVSLPSAMPGSRLLFSPLVFDVLALVDPPAKSQSARQSGLQHYSAAKSS